MIEIFIQTFFLYFIVIDPLGTTPLFLIVTQHMETKDKIKNSTNLTLSNPAAKVKGSPIIGTQANNKDHLPNLLNHFEDLSICSSLNGNHFFFESFLE